MWQNKQDVLPGVLNRGCGESRQGTLAQLGVTVRVEIGRLSVLVLWMDLRYPYILEVCCFNSYIHTIMRYIIDLMMVH